MDMKQEDTAKNPQNSVISNEIKKDYEDVVSISKNSIFIPTRKSFSKRISGEILMESPNRKTIQKANSLNAQFLIDVDKLIDNNNINGSRRTSFSETGSVISRASSNNRLGFSLALAGSTTMPSNEISDVLTLKNPNCSKTLIINSN